MRRAAWAVIVVLLAVSCSEPSPAGGGDPLVIAVGNWPNTHLGPWEVDDDFTLAAARAALGHESSCRARSDAYFAAVQWRGLGMRAAFGSYGLDGPSRPLCDRFAELAFSSARLTGWRWRTARGLRVGDSMGRLRELYPDATRRDGAWVLVDRYDDRDPYYGQPLLAAHVGDGRVVSLDLRLHREGD